MGLVHADGFDGTFNENPFNFQNFGVNEVILKKNDDSLPFHEMSLDYENDLYYDAYLGLIYGTGRLGRDVSMGITPSNFKNGCCLYCFDLTKNGADSNTFELNEFGTIQVNVRLSRALSHSIVMVFFLEYDAVLTIAPSNEAILPNYF